MMSASRKRSVCSTIFCVLFGAALLAAPASAQIPDKFTNLKVLPKDITKPELIGTMREFSSALGVRCGFCHARPEGDPHGEINWASDAKEEKDIARDMFKMTKMLNTKELPKIKIDDSERVDVGCRTCHHGQERPVRIEDHLTIAYRAAGFDSLKSTYEALREEYYGSDTFNFGEWMLLSLGDKLAGREKPAEALPFAEFNLKWFPESGMTYLAMAQAHAALGQKDLALEEIAKGVKLDPDLQENADHLLEQINKK